MKVLKAGWCLIVAFGLAVPALAQSHAKITATVLKVTYQKSADGKWYKAKIGTKLYAGYRVRTAKRSKCEIRFPDGSRIRMNERSDLAITEPTTKNVNPT